jgi:hypothetical protein
MKAKLTLTNPLWKAASRRRVLDKAVQESGAELEAEIKRTILESKPAGRTYRRGPITRKATAKNLPPGLRTQKGNSNNVIAGSNFHRASKKGQPPAVDTAGLINSIRAKKTGELKSTVATSKKYAEVLDDPKKLDRPFFKTTAEKFLPKFKENIKKAIGGK